MVREEKERRRGVVRGHRLKTEVGQVVRWCSTHTWVRERLSQGQEQK